MRLHHFVKIFTENEEDWTAAFQSILQNAAIKQRGGRKKGDWTAAQIILTNCPRSVPRAQTTSEVRKALRAARIDSMGRWADWAWDKSAQQPLTSAETLAVEVGTQIEVQSGEISNLPWYWPSGEKKLEAWKLHTKFGKTLFT
ncbi:hypothetical protein R1sor_002306 [Riccia sorocarpa]|uniref:Uncharacterized protein n=1 Tax=Riccia sorocarpa TaxID=122646 RepID=A0ABD3H140_9MARC